MWADKKCTRHLLGTLNQFRSTSSLVFSFKRVAINDDDGSIDPYQPATALNSHQVKGETSRMRRWRRRSWTCKKCQWYITLILHYYSQPCLQGMRTQTQQTHFSRGVERNNTETTRLRTGKKKQRECQGENHFLSASQQQPRVSIHTRILATSLVERGSKRKVISETLEERHEA